jgi:hypothetical protein
MKYNHYNIMLLVLRPITIPNKQEIFPIRVRAMVFNATFDYIFIISWWSIEPPFLFYKAIFATGVTL